MFGSIDITAQLEAFKKYIEAQKSFDIEPNLKDKEGSPVFQLNSCFREVVTRVADNEPLNSSLLFALLRLQALGELCHRRLTMRPLFEGKQLDYSEDIRCCDFAMSLAETTLLNHEHFYFKDLSVTAVESILMVPIGCHIYSSLAAQDILQAHYLWNSFFCSCIKRGSFVRATLAHLSEIADCKHLLEAQGWSQH